MKPVLPQKESLNVEFKSDRKKLPDSELVEAIVCLANTEGGEVWLGVEDNGTPTGLHADHRILDGLSGLIAARTSPSVTVRVTPVEINNVTVACIEVPKAHTIVSTSSGVYLRRRMKHDGTPECAPMLPNDRDSREASLGLVDVSAQSISNASLADFDPLERERLRQVMPKAGLVQAHGNTPRTRSYTLSAALYGELRDKAAFTRQAGFSGLQHEQMVLNFVRQHGQIKRADVMELCRLTKDQTWNLLNKLKQNGQFSMANAEGVATRVRRPDTFMLSNLRVMRGYRGVMWCIGDLITGENSAEALLVRIRAERETGSGKSTGRKRKVSA